MNPLSHPNCRCEIIGYESRKIVVRIPPSRQLLKFVSTVTFGWFCSGIDYADKRCVFHFVKRDATMVCEGKKFRVYKSGFVPMLFLLWHWFYHNVLDRRWMFK